MQSEPIHFALAPLKDSWHHFSLASLSVMGTVTSLSVKGILRKVCPPWHRLPESFAEFFDLIRFGDDTGKAVVSVVRHHRVVRIAARNDRPYPGVDLEQPPDRFLSSHAAGNGQVHDDRLKRFSGFSCASIACYCFGAVTGELDLISDVLQHFTCDLPDDLFIVHHEDFPFRFEEFALRTPGFDLLLPRGGKIERESCPSTYE